MEILLNMALVWLKLKTASSFCSQAPSKACGSPKPAMAKNSTLLFWCAFAVLSGVCWSMPLSPCLAPILPNVVRMVACVVLPSTVGCFNTLWNWFGAKVNVGGRNYENMSEQ